MHSWPIMVEIHVRHQQSAPAQLGTLNHDVQSVDLVECPPRSLDVARKTEVRSLAFVDPLVKGGLRIEFAQQAERSVDHPVIEPSGCYQRCNGHPFEQILRSF